MNCYIQKEKNITIRRNVHVVQSWTLFLSVQMVEVCEMMQRRYKSQLLGGSNMLICFVSVYTDDSASVSLIVSGDLIQNFSFNLLDH
jgi:hypothetical protein